MASGNPIESGYKYILAYGIMIGLAVLATKTRAGYTVVYYLLVLALLLILVTQSQFIADALKPITSAK